jgi:hypothetical protein
VSTCSFVFVFCLRKDEHDKVMYTETSQRVIPELPKQIARTYSRIRTLTNAERWSISRLILDWTRLID